MADGIGEPPGGSDDELDSPRDRWERGDDLDTEARRDAARQITRRALIWILPLTLVGSLLIGLGIPLWISVLAMVVALAVVVFEIDI